MNLRNSRRKRAVEMHNSALNDILFILLLFFLIVSTLANPNVIKLNLPKAKTNTKSKQTVVVSINGNREFFVGTAKVSFDQLKTSLIPALKRENIDPTIVINAEKSVPVEDVVSVMEVAREIGAKVVLATAHPTSGAPPLHE
ncbi:outer membrane transport energization protein ExbD [Chitinophaga costaii]|uniref:Outer membrane transport energization protein ExbD n=1 Tax=Chitinophaga costaii TaxID=1335309 RepID=A0A1C4D4Q5_9BACT|nr:biopolymer transporter ExbD [Chitinophaga costaii]PUZ24457.1 biopolymer transporter ExbD [Chitinophaga costaii]SCC26365.1 outer membrane transport energization protein ExbD [Chitinophaga costaii]